ncbi:serine/threonine/tyrosine-interacting-like protein 1 isoform X2 [Ornithorhynchus anatinus]|uniref:Serine/threonine/tyrosine interacting like 1 n=2 Tax=Ornithorhynchus anatinus TaxID=9258 RepID=A0A6I8NI75_ORNAN|nr:serine/threonine/tyrosine-interacting-like protein 1 isoform X2 [Ornithorhynchus anatinus]XP_028937536.1 serine/threonine/tyrosine-interacting-like protein 1 isoform X2 [Ornithorhynchus anatinus]
MSKIVLCEPTELYNILNQTTKLSRLTEPNYLCLLDARTRREYNESHVITARRVKQKGNEYLPPESVDLECVKYCVIYDGNTSSLEDFCDLDEDEEEEDEGDDEDYQGPVLGAAVECARVLKHITCHPVYILKGGYERFSSAYHFLRSQKEFWLPQELDAFQPYPVEIVPGQIFLGDFRQACDPQIQKDLKIKAHVNISLEAGPFFTEDKNKLLHIAVDDSPEEDLLSSFAYISHFIEAHVGLGSVILVFSRRGISRSCAAIVAYLMHKERQTLKRSWAQLLKCKANMRPNRGFVQQLSDWEKRIHGTTITDISDPRY